MRCLSRFYHTVFLTKQFHLQFSHSECTDQARNAKSFLHIQFQSLPFMCPTSLICSCSYWYLHFLASKRKRNIHTLHTHRHLFNACLTCLHLTYLQILLHSLWIFQHLIASSLQFPFAIRFLFGQPSGKLQEAERGKQRKTISPNVYAT